MKKLSANTLTLGATAGILLLLYAIASVRFSDQYFFTASAFMNLLTGNAHLFIIAIGMTFVILSGGIDLSVGATLCLTTVVAAKLLQIEGISFPLVVFLSLSLGTSLGAGMGVLIHVFKQAPFLVTLAGMFFARGLAQIISLESIPVKHSGYSALQDWYVFMPDWSGKSGLAYFDGPAITVVHILIVIVLLISLTIAHCTNFGRNVYAIGGNEVSAEMMQVPIGKTKVLIYALSGFCASLAGLVFLINVPSGNAAHGLALELDAIAAVVIGGTLLSGGCGSMLGTLMGVLIFGIVQMAIRFEPGIGSYWTRIILGLLFLTFIVLQRTLSRIVNE